MDVTVCVCTHDRPDYVGDCLDGLRQQTVGDGPFDVLVVDSASRATFRSVEHWSHGARNARLLRVEQPGVSLARNAGAQAAAATTSPTSMTTRSPRATGSSASVPSISETDPPPALIGGRILPLWEAPLPSWWPPSLRGALSIIELEGQGEYRSAALPRGLEPYGANMVVHVPSLRAIGGFGTQSGRIGDALLSDEEVQLAWRLQDAGHSARYNSRIVARHQIQTARLTPAWLLSRLYWQGVSTVRTRRLLGRPGEVWRELPRRIVVAALLAPSALLPRHSTHLVPYRWRLAYALGFIHAALGWGATGSPMRSAG